MKRIYSEPTIFVVKCLAQQLMSNSGVTSSKGISYGGTDSNGSVDPDAKRNSDYWDDEEEEDYEE